MAHLSKSLLNNYRQCPRRLWLDMQDREAKREGNTTIAPVDNSSGMRKRFLEGHVIGRIAKAGWPDGVDIEAQSLGAGSGSNRLSAALVLTQQSLSHRKPLFEATFKHQGLLIQADILLPVRGGWSLLEVKSSSEPKPYHIHDLATQAWVVEQCGVKLPQLGLVLVDKKFTLQHQGDYTHFLNLHTAQDLQRDVREAQSQVPAALRGATSILAGKAEPTRYQPGEQCTSPFECPYIAHCTGVPHQSRVVPIRFYRDKDGAKAQALTSAGHTDMRRVPAATIAQLWSGESETHRINQRIGRAVSTGKAVLDRKGALAMLDRWTWPVQHLDFETISFIAPVWNGTRTNESIPFQYSLHVQARNGQVLAHKEFLDTGGKDPRRSLAERLVKDIKPHKTVVSWNATFEKGVIKKLAQCFADLSEPLLRIHGQIEDLLPVVRNNYFHPAMVHAGPSLFSIKNVLPCIAPHLSYTQLDSVQDGGQAQIAYLLAAAPAGAQTETGRSITPAERLEARNDLLAYCKLDTLAMVEVVNFLVN